MQRSYLRNLQALPAIRLGVRFNRDAGGRGHVPGEYQ